MANLMWMVRAGRESAYIEDFLRLKIAAIGWASLGDLTNVHTRQDLAELVAEKFPDDNVHQAASTIGQVYRFRDGIHQGDKVVSYQSSARLYHLGTVKGDYAYTPNLGIELSHSRSVEWLSSVPRDSLTPKTKSSLGSISTIFRISEAASEELTELSMVPGGLTLPITAESIVQETAVEEEEELRQDTVQQARDFMQDRLARLNGYQMQDFVAGLLRAMGYRTRVSAKGSDRGVDIIASHDGFGFQQPRIKVEVKHRSGAMSSQDIRSFTGGLRPHDSGLYVSTGGFTKDARYEADRSNHPLLLMDLKDLSDAIWEHYDKMDAETCAMLPLKKIYWPL